MGENALDSKNIVLCSDGTGNAGGKGKGTNVWRLFQAVDLSKGDQVAFHDDGVGTGDFKLFKAIGGATGFGLGQNIRQLYASLVRVYDPGDRAYLFGFSRGAYTVRSLANFIDRFGILDRHAFDTPEQLKDEIRGMYSAYRKGKRRDEAARNADKDPKFCTHPEGVIAFLGVWDTVDAIGVPFDELRKLLRCFSPWKHHEYELNSSIKAAFHALAIDEERKTFHPTMFDEGKPAKDTKRVEQVWFTGVHSNVGGGYPKDQIAYISLRWVMERAADPNLYPGYVELRFHDGLREQYADAANPYGKVYDSRAGLMAYYRFSPRDIGHLCGEANAGTPKIHASVMTRISRRTAGYAPFNIPRAHEVVDPSSGGDVDLGPNDGFMLRARGITGWRRCLYATFLLVTSLFVVVVAWQTVFYPDVEAAGWLSRIAGAVKGIVPDFLAGAVDAAFLRVGWPVMFAGVFGLLFWLRGFLKGLVDDLAGLGWRAAYLAANLAESPPEDDSAKNQKRRRQLLQIESVRARVTKSTFAAVAWMAKKAWPGGWAWCAVWLALIVMGGYLVGWRHPAADWADACSAPHLAAAEPEGAWHMSRFETADPCYRTGIPLQEGRRYAVAVTAEGWFDSSIPAGPGGFQDPADAEGWRMKLWRPALRVSGPGYFVLMGQVIGAEPSPGDPETTRPVPLSDPFVIGAAAEPMHAPATGELVLFVNDVLCPLCPPGTYGFYANNKGNAIITVKKLD